MNADTLTENIKGLIEQTQDLAKVAHAQYVVEVDDVVENEITDSNHIEMLFDRMLDFCFDKKVLFQYKKLCRYYYKIAPQATVDYVNIYRKLWDNDDKKK